MPPKASPFHDANPDLSLEKIYAQRGAITPSESGLTLEDREPGEKSPLEIQQEQQEMNIKMKGQPGQGRPINKKDSKKRKGRTVTTTKAEEFVNLTLWAQDIQKSIADTINPFFLEKFEKDNLRQLTEAESKELENFKLVVMSNFEAYADVNEEKIYNLIQEPLSVYNDMEDLVNQFAAEIVERRGVEPNLDELRKIHCLVYALYKGDLDGNN